MQELVGKLNVIVGTKKIPEWEIIEIYKIH